MTSSRKILAALAATAALGWTGIAGAAITGGTATITAGGTALPDLFVTIPTPSSPPTVGIGSYDVNDFVFGFNEKTVLAGSWTVDGGGSVSGPVQSHYIFFDPAATQSVTGTVTFAFPILGVISTTAGLAATDATFGAAGVVYGSVGATGLEPSTDSYSFPVLGSTLTYTWSASDPGDHIRVLTAVPEPGTYAMMIAGIALLGFIARRRMLN